MQILTQINIHFPQEKIKKVLDFFNRILFQHLQHPNPCPKKHSHTLKKCLNEHLYIYFFVHFFLFELRSKRKKRNQRKKVHARYKSKILALNKETDKLGICDFCSAIKFLRQYPLLGFRLCFRLYHVVQAQRY